MKQGKTEKAVFTKLSAEKVEKLELGSMQEVQSLLTKMSKLEQELKTAGKELEKFESTFSQYKKEIDDYNSKTDYYSDLQQQYIDIKKGGAGVSMDTVEELADKADKLGLGDSVTPIINKAYAAFEALADAVRPVMTLDSKIYRSLN
jgi:phenylalanyl-tRNA synthetase alpha subunit